MSDPQEFTDLYESTVLTTWNPAQPDLPIDMGAAARARGRDCVIMTAWNPGHERPARSVNEAANARMLRELESMGLEVWRCDGANPDGTFDEPGFCVWSAPVDDVLNVARSFGQYAVFTVDGSGERSLLWL